MALKYLLDTNVVSEMTRPLPNEATVLAIRQHEAWCAICASTLEELTFGCANMRSAPRKALVQRWLAGLIETMPVLPFDQQAAVWLGRERARLQTIGRPAPRADGEIAAVAVTQGLTLVTRNRRDFEGFVGLRVEDWYAAPGPE